MAELNQQQVVDYIKGISVLELSQLVKALETELGVSAAAAMPMAMPAGGGAAAGGGVEESELLSSSEPQPAMVPAEASARQARSVRGRRDMGPPMFRAGGRDPISPSPLRAALASRGLSLVSRAVPAVSSRGPAWPRRRFELFAG